MALQAVLWDMDGTLMNPNGSIRIALDAAVTFGGFEPFHPGDILIGMPLRDILAKRTTDADAIEAMVAEFRRVTLEETWQLATWYPGVKETVAWCREQGLKNAVVTTKGQVEVDNVLTERAETGLFDAIVGDDDVRPVKPHPAPVLHACRLLGVKPEDAVMIGDTRYDVEAGKAAGCTTIGVTWGHGTSGHGPEAADFVVDSSKSLQETLADLLQSHNA